MLAIRPWLISLRRFDFSELAQLDVSVRIRHILEEVGPPVLWIGLLPTACGVHFSTEATSGGHKERDATNPK